MHIKPHRVTKRSCFCLNNMGVNADKCSSAKLLFFVEELFSKTVSALELQTTPCDQKYVDSLILCCVDAP